MAASHWPLFYFGSCFNVSFNLTPFSDSPFSWQKRHRPETRLEPARLSVAPSAVLLCLSRRRSAGEQVPTSWTRTTDTACRCTSSPSFLALCSSRGASFSRQIGTYRPTYGTCNAKGIECSRGDRRAAGLSWCAIVQLPISLVRIAVTLLDCAVTGCCCRLCSTTSFVVIREVRRRQPTSQLPIACVMLYVSRL